jgi:hypothetical protein
MDNLYFFLILARILAKRINFSKFIQKQNGTKTHDFN